MKIEPLQNRETQAFCHMESFSATPLADTLAARVIVGFTNAPGVPIDLNPARYLSSEIAMQLHAKSQFFRIRKLRNRPRIKAPLKRVGISKFILNCRNKDEMNPESLETEPGVLYPAVCQNEIENQHLHQFLLKY